MFPRAGTGPRAPAPDQMWYHQMVNPYRGQMHNNNYKEDPGRRRAALPTARFLEQHEEIVHDWKNEVDASKTAAPEYDDWQDQLNQFEQNDREDRLLGPLARHIEQKRENARREWHAAILQHHENRHKRDLEVQQGEFDKRKDTSFQQRKRAFSELSPGDQAAYENAEEGIHFGDDNVEDAYDDVRTRRNQAFLGDRWDGDFSDIEAEGDF